MGRFMLSVAVALAVAAPCGVWAVETASTPMPAAHAPAAKPKVEKTRKVAVTPAPKRKKTPPATGTTTY